jgi:hypothetical protein
VVDDVLPALQVFLAQNLITGASVDLFVVIAKVKEVFLGFGERVAKLDSIGWKSTKR